MALVYFTQQRLHSKLHVLCLIFAVLLFAGVASAQSDSGRIVGTVKDQNGAIVPGATVIVTNDRTGEARTATSTAPGAFGNVPRNFLRGPNFRQFDLVFRKRFKFSETTNLEFRTEIFNVFNRANFDIPGSRLNLALPSSTFTPANPATGATAFYTIPTGLQPGSPYTQGTAGERSACCVRQ